MSHTPVMTSGGSHVAMVTAGGHPNKIQSINQHEACEEGTLLQHVSACYIFVKEEARLCI